MRSTIITFLLNISFFLTAQDPQGYVFKKKYYPTQRIVDISATSDTIFVTKYIDPVTNNFIISNIFLGTPFYMNKGFKYSTLYLDGSVIEDNITYNLLYKNILLSPYGAEESTIVIPDSFIVNNTKFVKLYPKYRLAYYKDYYELILEINDVKLYRKIDLSLKNLLQPKEIIYENNPYIINASYVKSYTYFYAKNDTFKEIKQNSKIIKLFGKSEKEIEKFIFANNLNPKKEQDLLKIFDYYAKSTFNN
jgi:hypothetical protein